MLQAGANMAKKAIKRKLLLMVLPYVLPFVLFFSLLLLVVFVQIEDTNPIHFTLEQGQNKGVSEKVLRFKEPIAREMKAQGLDDAWLPLVLALVMQESGGNAESTPDIFQASESLGLGMNALSTEQSIKQGITHFKGKIEAVKGIAGHEPSPTNESDVRTLLVLYNVPAFGQFLKDKYGGKWTKQANDDFYRNELPKYGVGPGDIEYSDHILRYYSFEKGTNPIDKGVAIPKGKGQEFFNTVMKEVVQYQGQPYVFGGKNPQMGFDCSGIVSWGLAKVGIQLPSYTVTQWDMTTEVSPSEAKAGDLIFFRGTYGSPDFISHIEFYVDENTMYGSNGSGVGFHNWKDAYWQQHFAGVRRIKN